MSVFSRNPNPRRILALWFPYLPTDRLQVPDHAPLVVTEKVSNALRLYAVNPQAAHLGLTRGQPLANARAMIPDLRVVTANPQADHDDLNCIADWCDRFTPHVAIDPPHGLLLDVTGVAHLFGGEEKMLRHLSASLQQRKRSVHGAIAGTSLAARAFAHHRNGMIIPPGEESQAVSALPITALGLDPVTTHAFRRAGLKTIGQAAARKRTELTARFGAATVTTLDEALGREARSISPRKPRPHYHRTHIFAEPVLTADVILPTLKRLATHLAQDMEQHGDGARKLEARCDRTDGITRTITIETGAATRDATVITRLFQEKLDHLADPLDPGFGFDRISLAAIRVEKVHAQIASLDQAAANQHAIDFLIDRLSARFGPHRVLAFQSVDTHLPETAWRISPAQYTRSTSQDWRKLNRLRSSPHRPVRLFARPEPVVLLPAHLNWRKAPRHIIRRNGPERIATEWWRQREPQATRDYMSVQDDEGRRYWLYRHVGEDRWLMHGLFA
jgi:protein ImuB